MEYLGNLIVMTFCTWFLKLSLHVSVNAETVQKVAF